MGWGMRQLKPKFRTNAAGLLISFDHTDEERGEEEQNEKEN
jgi:hypothetical protein